MYDFVVRSYGQFCALARTMDVLGDRWTLLIIRELFARDSRYSDLRESLPGIATNLLAERLRQLHADGVIEPYDAPPPVRATVYRLTPRGRELGPALRALVAWGAPLVDEQGTDEFRTHWLALGLPALFADVDVTDLAPLTVLVRTGDQPAVLEVSDDGITMRNGEPSVRPTIEIDGPPDKVYAYLSGTAGAGTPEGLRVKGARDAIRRLRALTARSHAANTRVSR